MEELASGPKLAYDDNIGLLNFSENLNAATRILKGDVEREASVAMNLRRIVSRLPNDLILKWQTVNYELVKSGRSARLKDVAEFLHKQASIRNDPVFGLRTLKRENKNTKLLPKLAVRNTTINTTGVGHKTPASDNNEHCGICKSRKRHKLQECPIIKQCEDSMRHPVDFVLIVVLKGPDTVLAPVRTHQHVQYVPVDTFLFCTLKVIMVVVASSHGIIESLMISLTSHWQCLNPQTAKKEMSFQPRAETSLTSL